MSDGSIAGVRGLKRGSVDMDVIVALVLKLSEIALPCRSFKEFSLQSFTNPFWISLDSFVLWGPFSGKS